MQRGRVLILIAAGTAAAALLFPFFTAPAPVGAIRNNVHLLPFSGITVAALVAMAGDRGESLSGLAAIAAATATTGAVVLTAAIFIDALIADRDAQDLGLDATVGTGLWLTLIAAGLAALGIGIAMSRRLS